jgi:hypothetical protein
MLFGIDLIMFFVSAVARLESDLCEEDEEMVTPPRCNSSDMQHNRCQRVKEVLLHSCHVTSSRNSKSIRGVTNIHWDGVLFMSRRQWRTTRLKKCVTSASRHTMGCQYFVPSSFISSAMPRKVTKTDPQTQLKFKVNACRRWEINFVVIVFSLI